MNPIKTAVIGVGHMGRWHADKYKALENSDFVGIADPNMERCSELAGELGVQAIADYHDLIGKVDAVSIATPTGHHFEIAKTCLENGIHVLLEKPITKTVDEARALVALAEKNKLILQVGHLERFNPAVIALAENVSSPLFIESHRIAPFKPRSLDVSVVLDLMIHDIDLIHSLVRSRMTSVHAIGSPIISDSIDIANARIEFENGCVANVTSSRISFKVEQTLRVFEDSAYFSVDLFNKKGTLYRKKGDGPVHSPEDIEIENWSGEASDALLTQSQAFLNSVATGTPPIVSGQIGLEALETAIAISESIGESISKKTARK